MKRIVLVGLFLVGFAANAHADGNIGWDCLTREAWCSAKLFGRSLDLSKCGGEAKVKEVADLQCKQEFQEMSKEEQADFLFLQKRYQKDEKKYLKMSAKEQRKYWRSLFKELDQSQCGNPELDPNKVVDGSSKDVSVPKAGEKSVKGHSKQVK